MTFEEAKEFLKRVTYRDGWAFKIYRARNNGSFDYVVQAAAEVLDAYHPGKTTLTWKQLRVPRELFEDMGSPHLLMMFVWQAIAGVEDHERQEHLKIDGRLAYDPHIRGVDAPHYDYPDFFYGETKGAVKQ